MAEAHVRIDEGVKRGKRKTPQNGLESPRSIKGTYLPIYSQEKRTAVILSVPDAIRNGQTTRQIAEQHQIPLSTLQAWIVGNPDVEEARGAMIASELCIRMGEIDTAEDPLGLARAREGFRAWSWIAERRESRLYGQKQEVKVDIDMTVTVEHSLAEEAKTLIAKIRGSKPSPVIDLTPEEPDLT